MLLGDAPPPSAAIRAAEWLAWLATVAVLIGLRTRTAAAVSLFASLTVASWSVSFQPDWPHDNNLPLLARLALQGTRGGDVLGLDGWWRRRHGRPAPAATSWSAPASAGR